MSVQLLWELHALFSEVVYKPLITPIGLMTHSKHCNIFSLQVLKPVASIQSMLLWKAMYCDPPLSLYFEPRPSNPDSWSLQDEDGAGLGKEPGVGSGRGDGVESSRAASGVHERGLGRGVEGAGGVRQAKADSTGSVADNTSPSVGGASSDSTVTSQPVGASGGVSGGGKGGEDGHVGSCVGANGGEAIEGALGSTVGVTEGVDGGKVSTDDTTPVPEGRLSLPPDRASCNGENDSGDASVGGMSTGTSNGSSTEGDNAMADDGDVAIAGRDHGGSKKNGLSGGICGAVSGDAGTVTQDDVAVSNGDVIPAISNGDLRGSTASTAGASSAAGEGEGRLSSRLSDHDFHESLHVLRSEGTTALPDGVGEGAGPGRVQATPTKVPDSIHASGPSVHDDEYLTLSPAFGIPATAMLEMLPMQGVSSPPNQGGANVVAGLVEAAQDSGCGQEGVKQCDDSSIPSRPSLTSNEDTTFTL